MPQELLLIPDMFYMEVITGKYFSRLATSSQA